MLSVISRNSTGKTTVRDITELKEYLVKCGHQEEKLEEIEPLAVHRAMINDAERNMLVGVEATTSNQLNLVFTTKFFKDANLIKSFIRKLESDIKQIAGDLRIISASKRTYQDNKEW